MAWRQGIGQVVEIKSLHRLGGECPDDASQGAHAGTLLGRMHPVAEKDDEGLGKRVDPDGGACKASVSIGA